MGHLHDNRDCGGFCGRSIRLIGGQSHLWSDSVSDDFQFGGTIYGGEEMIDP
jgi:hypothetical protein